MKELLKDAANYEERRPNYDEAVYPELYRPGATGEDSKGGSLPEDAATGKQEKKSIVWTSNNTYGARIEKRG
jgi:hypothetical protein